MFVKLLCYRAAFLLGAVGTVTYDTQSIAFAPGDALLLYSDALTETPDKQGNLLDTDDGVALFAPDAKQGIDQLLGRIGKQYSQTWPDDLTVTGYYFN